MALVVAAQGADPDPWSRVPAAPALTSCYGNDGFWQKTHQPIAAIAADIAKQHKLNADLKASYANF